MTKRPVLLIDAYNVFTRHFCANPTMNRHGEPIGGAVGFLNGLKNIVSEVFPSAVYIIWEGGGSSKRRKLFPDYKKNKKPQRLNRFYSEIPDTVSNRNNQVTFLVNLLKNAPVCQIYVSDCEADDVIGYMSKNMFTDKECVIYSSDKDFYQLVSERVTIFSPTSKKYIHVDDVLERFSIHPENFCQARTFCGDTSDGIPGIKGVGFKVLAKRFPELSKKEFVSVNDIISLSEQRTKESKVQAYQKIVESADIARRNWKLMHLDTVNLTGTQIQKIEGVIDTFTPARNKIAMMRALSVEGLHTFDVDALFLSLNFALRG
jgi:DNA polymerase-1